MNAALTIGQIAKRTGLTVETVRFYEKKGLILAPERSESGYRQYSSDTLKRLYFILRAKEVGFTLNDIAELLDIRRKPGSTCSDIKLRALEKMEDIEKKVTDLQKIHDSLSQLVLRCSGTGKLSDCPILESLDFGDDS